MGVTNVEAIKWLLQIKGRYINGGDESFDSRRREAIDLAIERLKEQPDIVRCKDCIYLDEKFGTGYCDQIDLYPEPDWFCADGERKQNG